MARKSTRILLLLGLALLPLLGGCRGNDKLALGEEARRLNASLVRNEPSLGTSASGRLDVQRPRTIYDSAAVILALGTDKRRKTLNKLLGDGALGKLNYEILAAEAQRWSSVSGAVVFGGDEQQLRRENAWLALNLSQTYARINTKNAKKRKGREIAAEQLLQEAVTGFWSQLNSQRFSVAINSTRRDLQVMLARGDLNAAERLALTRFDQQLLQNSSQIATRAAAFGGGAGRLLARSKVYRRLQANALLPTPELLSITYTTELVDRIAIASFPRVRLGATRSDRVLPKIESLSEALETMPYLGLFTVPPRVVRAFNNLADEQTMLKISYAVAWGQIDLQYRRNTLEPQIYRQSQQLLSVIARMLSARLALLSYDRALQRFAESLWQFQRFERALLDNKPTSAEDPRGLVFLQAYSRHLLSAVSASEAYAESLVWSLRVALTNNFLQAPSVGHINTPDKLSRNADRIEARLRQTPGLLAMPLESGNTKLVFGLPPRRRQALESAIAAREAIQANARTRIGGSTSPLYAPKPSIFVPTQQSPSSQKLFEQGSSVYRRLQRSYQEQNALPRLQKPSWLENPTEEPTQP